MTGTRPVDIRFKSAILIKFAMQKKSLSLYFTFLLALIASPLFAQSNFSAVRQRIQELQPTSREKRFDEIGWAGGIREAERLARERHRAVFLFTHDGHMNVGRC